MERKDGRGANEPRKTQISHNIQEYAEGSVLIEVGSTKIICAVSIENTVPTFLRSTGKGWITAEYSMLPRSTHTRTQRESSNRPKGRSQEIQRLIGRSLRAITDLTIIGERTIYIDCDVLQADGGTRTAAITGSYVAICKAFDKMILEKDLEQNPLKSQLAAISVGIVKNNILLDLCYEEDSIADVDMNIVMTNNHEIIEIQGTAEQSPFSINTANEMIKLGASGIDYLVDIQNKALTNN
ncbi:MAG: ribonuclease PH [Dehalococcoidia bacterium]